MVYCGSSLTSPVQECIDQVQLIAEGRAAKEIAFRLNISIKTVAFHRENIKKKLGLGNTAELTKHAIEQGLISLEALPDRQH
jgi:DNA-binding CsgD family transcriptional regulator